MLRRATSPRSGACRGRRRWPGRPPARPSRWSTTRAVGRGRACSTANSAACVRLVRPELGQDVRDVGPGGPLGHPELLGDRPVGQAARDAGEHVAFAGRQAGPRPAVRPPSAGRRRPRRRASGGRRSRPRPDRGGPRRHAAARIAAGQVVRLGVLEQEAARAGLERGRDPVLLDEARDRDDLDRRVAALSSAVAAMPSMPGISRSMTTTSGSSAAAMSSAAAPSAASPTTSRSSCRSRKSRMPRRTIAWSSTIRTRIRAGTPRTAIGRGRARHGRRIRSPARDRRARRGTARRALEDQRGGQDGDGRRATWIGARPSSSSHAASATPTTGSNSIRMPARVPPTSRMPVRNRMRRDGRREEAGEHQERQDGRVAERVGERPRRRRSRRRDRGCTTTVTARTTLIAWSAGHGSGSPSG